MARWPEGPPDVAWIGWESIAAAASSSWPSRPHACWSPGSAATARTPCSTATPSPTARCTRSTPTRSARRSEPGIGSREANEQPELSASEPMIEDAVAETVTADPAFRAAFRDGAARLHDALFGDPDADASMVVAGSGAMVRAELERRGRRSAAAPGRAAVHARRPGTRAGAAEAGAARARRRAAALARAGADRHGAARALRRGASATTGARCGRPGWRWPPPPA